MSRFIVRFFKMILLCIFSSMSLNAAGPYIFSSGATVVGGSFFTTNNLKTRGFTINSGATVQWNVPIGTASSNPITGPITIQDGGIFSLNSSFALYSAGTFDVESTASFQVNSNAQLILQSGCVAVIYCSLNISSNAVLTIQNNAALIIFGQLFMSAANASLTIQSGGELIVGDGGDIDGVPTNLFTIDSGGMLLFLNGGSTAFNGTFTNNGLTAAAAGSVIYGVSIDNTTSFPLASPHAEVVPLLVSGDEIGSGRVFTSSQCSYGFVVYTDALVSIVEGESLTPLSSPTATLFSGSLLTLDPDALSGFTISGSGSLNYRVLGTLLTTVEGGDPKASYRAGLYAYDSSGVFRGLMIFKNGFQTPTGGSIFYDAAGSVYGDIVLTSTLILGTDLHLSGTGNLLIYSGATLDGRGNAIYLGGSVGLDKELKITSSLIIDGCGHSLILEDGADEVNNGRFSIDNRATLTLRNMNLVMKNSQKDTFLRPSNAGYVCLQNVTIWLDSTNDNLKSVFGASSANGDANSNMIVIDGFVKIHGPGARLYVGGTRFDNPNISGGASILVNKNSTLYLGLGCIFDLRYMNVPPDKKIGLQDKTSSIWLDGCTIHLQTDSLTAGNEGLLLARGILFIEDKVIFEDTIDGMSVNTAIDKGFIFGDGLSADTDLDVRVLSNAYAIIQGCFDYRHS